MELLVADQLCPYNFLLAVVPSNLDIYPHQKSSELSSFLISGLLLEKRSSKLKGIGMAQPLFDQILKAMAERRPKPFVSETAFRP